jgi:RNA polymerase sigma-70 factor (ECF subfamily)
VKDSNVPIYDATGVTSPSVTSSSLLAQVRAADPSAWSRLVRLYGPMVYSWCRHAGLRAQDSSDIAQEVFQSVFTAMATFRRDRPGDSFRSWLKTITRNKIRDLWRRQQRQPAAIGGSDARRYIEAIPDTEIDVSDDSDDSDEHEQLYQRALELLRSECEPTDLGGIPASRCRGMLGK